MTLNKNKIYMWGVVGLTTKDECLNSPPKGTKCD